MTKKTTQQGFLDLDALLDEPLPLRGDGRPDSWHVFDSGMVHAVNAALATQQPLLVRGEPGTGKSQLARAAALALGRVFVSYAVDADTGTRDLLYQIDAVARLGHAQLLSARSDPDLDVQRELDLARFTSPGPLWWAFAPHEAHSMMGDVRLPVCDVRDGERAVKDGLVVLIDEIDKADRIVPNGLLDALGEGRFRVPGRPEPVVAREGSLAPLVVITTNEERALPDAFLRRCWVCHLALPEGDALLDVLVTRLQVHYRDTHEDVLHAVAGLLVDERRRSPGESAARPGLAEALQLVGAVVRQAKGRDAQLTLLDAVAPFVLRKQFGPS